MLNNVMNMFAKATLPLILIVIVTSCVGDSADDSVVGTGSTTESFNYTKMMANYADNLLLPLYRQTQQQLKELAEIALPNYCEAIGQVDDREALGLAQSQWRTVMNSWQQSELLWVGPAIDNAGAGRNAIYSYASGTPPNSCAVDQSVALAQHENFSIESRAFNSRGLDALEYLLFNSQLEHTCPVQIIETQQWNSLGVNERKRQRCAYAIEVAEDARRAIEALISAWDFNEGNYRTQFVNPANNAQSLKSLSDALFYIEKETKDLKLGLPTGIHGDCREIACPAAAESPYSLSSLKNIEYNVLGFYAAFNGRFRRDSGEEKAGLGFSDIIVAEGFPGVVDAFNADVALLLDLLSLVQEPLVVQSQALFDSGDRSECENSAANPEIVQTRPICSLHGALKRLTDRLRIDFIAIVNLDLPERGQSDND